MTKSKKNIILDEYESEILEAFENGEIKLVEPETDFQTIARNTMKKNRKINIRISENDLTALQRKAAREGMPYQTLIDSVLHNLGALAAASAAVIMYIKPEHEEKAKKNLKEWFGKNA